MVKGAINWGLGKTSKNASGTRPARIDDFSIAIS